MSSGLERRLMKTAGIGSATAAFVRKMGLGGTKVTKAGKSAVKGAKDVLPPSAIARAKRGGPLLGQGPRPKKPPTIRSDTVTGSVTRGKGEWAAYAKKMQAKKPAGLSWPPKQTGGGSGWAALRK
jgi:hypothetical protein